MAGNTHRKIEYKWIVDEVSEIERDFERKIKEAQSLANEIVRKAYEKYNEILQEAEEEGIRLVSAYREKGRIEGEEQAKKIIRDTEGKVENLLKTKDKRVKKIAEIILKTVLNE